MKLRWMGPSLFLALSCCFSVSVAMAGTPPVPIEGKLWVSGYEYQSGWYAYAYYLHGTSDQVTAWPGQIEHADVSPLGDALVYQVTAGQPWTTTGDIWITALDGSTNTDVSQAAGLSGINCFPSWSPDASQIAFRHVDPVVGQQPCDTGFQVWVMNVGVGMEPNPRRVSPVGAASTKLGGWSADGHSLVCAVNGVAGAVIMGLDGSTLQSLPNVRGEGADISPDALRIAGTWAKDDTVSGEAGVWRELVVADLDGSNPQTLVSQFIKQSDAQAMVTRIGLDPSVTDWVADIEWRVGPLFPQWSPDGDRIAFLAALPFDPNGPDYREQVQVWVYTLSSGDLTKITNDTLKRDIWLSWSGENTSAAHPSVTVDNTTVTFSQVAAPGLTTIIQEGPAATVLADQVAVPPFFWIYTTAQVSSPASVSMTYDDAAVPAAAEAHLALAHYDPESRMWFTQPSAVDPVHNVVTGQVVSLGGLGLMWPLPSSQFSDVTSSATDPYWALWEIEAAYAAGIVQGYSDGTYKPTDPVTRDQMAVYISRALAGGDASVPAFTGTPSFSDVDASNWALKYVQYAVSKGVVKGYSDGTYKPTEQVDRGQMSVFIARAIATPTAGVDLVNYTPPTTATFPDVPTTFWAYKYVEYIAQPAIAVTQGYPDGGYHPEYVCTRDQMAVYVARAFKLLL